MMAVAEDPGAAENPGTGVREAADTEGVEQSLLGTAVAALVVGAALAWSARVGAVELLVAVAVVQAVLASSWVFGLRVPGRFGALVLAALTASASDVTVSVWPHSRLGTLLAVLGLAVPVMFVHQLLRGAARVRMVESLGSIALLVVAEVALSALLQLRHEFIDAHRGGEVVSAVVLIGAAAMIAGCLADLAIAAPRFDRDVPRGLLAVLVSAGLGAALGQLTLRDPSEFTGGRGAVIGAALGAIVALLAVVIAFVEHAAPRIEPGFGQRVRPVLAAVFPLCLLAPIALLLCLTIRR